MLALQGPRATDILRRHTAAELDEIGYYQFAHGAVAGAECIISRTGYTGEDGFELYLAPEDAPAVWDALLESGAGDGLVPAGLGARDTLRLEAGMALYGHEIDRTTTPYEAGLGWVVKLKSGDFINAAQFREITFESTSVKQVSGDMYEMTGNLTLMGETRKITAELQWLGTGEMRGATLGGFEARFSIDRTDYGMDFMVGPLGRDVDLIVALEGRQQ